MVEFHRSRPYKSNPEKRGVGPQTDWVSINSQGMTEPVQWIKLPRRQLQHWRQDSHSAKVRMQQTLTWVVNVRNAPSLRRNSQSLNKPSCSHWCPLSWALVWESPLIASCTEDPERREPILCSAPTQHPASNTTQAQCCRNGRELLGKGKTVRRARKLLCV